MKKVISVLLACVLVMGLAMTSASANSDSLTQGQREETSEVINFDDLLCEPNLDSQNCKQLVERTRATTRIEFQLKPGVTGIGSRPFTLEADEVVTINCTYSPRTADIDFGFVAPDGSFHYLPGSDGSMRENIVINESGQYYLAIRNNDDNAVEVLGYVYY